MYLWLKAFHIIALVAWFSGLFYLPRLFVYHTQVSTKDILNYTRFCIMEHKLFYYITTPAAVITSLLGLWLLVNYSYAFLKTSGWLHLKLSLVLLLWGYHIYCGKLVGEFKQQNNQFSEKFYRLFNEIPTFFLISIVILVVVKPF